MASILKPPCDEGVIHAAPVLAPTSTEERNIEP